MKLSVAFLLMLGLHFENAGQPVLAIEINAQSDFRGESGGAGLKRVASDKALNHTDEAVEKGPSGKGGPVLEKRFRDRCRWVPGLCEKHYDENGNRMSPEEWLSREREKQNANK